MEIKTQDFLDLNLMMNTSYAISYSDNRFGALRQKKSDKPFDMREHKQQYDTLAQYVIEHCQTQMVEKHGLLKINVPENYESKNKREFPKCPIFMSKEFYQPDSQANNGKTALVLIQGTGAVRAGIWARSVSINENFELGTMLPQIEWAVREKHFPVLVMNPNYNKEPESGKSIPLSETGQKHALHVWKNYVVNSGFSRILVLAHSAGGVCLANIMQEFQSTFYKMVGKVALTDSYVISGRNLTPEQLKWIEKNTIHYVASEEELGKQLTHGKAVSICTHVSAGHDRHEYTTGCSWPMIRWQFELT